MPSMTGRLSHVQAGEPLPPAGGEAELRPTGGAPSDLPLSPWSGPPADQGEDVHTRVQSTSGTTPWQRGDR